MITISIDENKIQVYRDDESIGFITYSTNSYHNQNLYLEFHLKEYNLEDSIELFNEIEHSFSMPIQVMIYENELDIIRFIKYSGFQLKRSCYEYLLRKKDLKKMSFTKIALEKITPKNCEYKICLEMLYNKYKETHKTISPLTATLEEFCVDLPKEVYIERKLNQITNYAFVEHNEIAYVGSLNSNQFESFILSVVEDLFEQYDNIEFEVDDNDIEMNILKNCFHYSKGISYDTFLKTI